MANSKQELTFHNNLNTFLVASILVKSFAHIQARVTQLDGREYNWCFSPVNGLQLCFYSVHHPPQHHTTQREAVGQTGNAHRFSFLQIALWAHLYPGSSGRIWKMFWIPFNLGRNYKTTVTNRIDLQWRDNTVEDVFLACAGGTPTMSNKTLQVINLSLSLAFKA